MAKIQMLIKTEKQNSTCIGTALTCTGTAPRILPRMWVFLPFFHRLLTKSTQYSIYTSKPLQIHLEISILLNSSFITYLSSKLFMNYSQNKSIMGHNPYINQIQGFVRVYSNTNSFTLQLNHESNLKGRIPCFSCTFGVLPTLLSIIFGLG